MEHMKVYVGKIEGYRKSTIVRRNNKWCRYILGEAKSPEVNSMKFSINLELFKLTDIKTEEDLKAHLLAQRILGG